MTAPAKPTRFSGAAVRQTDLVIITVKRDGEGFVICDDASARIVLLDRSQAELQHFASELACFLDQADIQRLVLRAAPEAGPNKGHPCLYKMEALLQLQKGLAVSMVTEATLAKWDRHSGNLTPPVHPSVTTKWETDLHRCAIRAACLSAMGWPHPSWCEHEK